MFQPYAKCTQRRYNKSITVQHICEFSPNNFLGQSQRSFVNHHVIPGSNTIHHYSTLTRLGSTGNWAAYEMNHKFRRSGEVVRGPTSNTVAVYTDRVIPDWNSRFPDQSCTFPRWTSDWCYPMWVPWEAKILRQPTLLVVWRTNDWKKYGSHFRETLGIHLNSTDSIISCLLTIKVNREA